MLGDVFTRDTLVDRSYNEFLCLRVGSQQAEVGHYEGRPQRADTQALPVVAPAAIAERGDEIHSLHERAACLAHHDVRLGTEAGNLRCSSPAWQPHLWMFVAADDAGVDVAEAINLRPAEEANRDATALQPVLEHLWD